LFSDFSLFVQTNQPSDFDPNLNISFLPFDFQVNNNSFKTIPANSIVVLDDFSFPSVKRQENKIEFLKVINYSLRHNNITLILVVHNLYNTNMATEILLAPHIFLSYSNLGYTIMR